MFPVLRNGYAHKHGIINMCRSTETTLRMCCPQQKGSGFAVSRWHYQSRETRTLSGVSCSSFGVPLFRMDCGTLLVDFSLFSHGLIWESVFCRFSHRNISCPCVSTLFQRRIASFGALCFRFRGVTLPGSIMFRTVMLFSRCIVLCMTIVAKNRPRSRISKK